MRDDGAIEDWILVRWDEQGEHKSPGVTEGGQLRSRTLMRAVSAT